MRRLLLLIFAIALVAAPGAASGYTLIAGNDGEDQVLLHRVLRKFELPISASFRPAGGEFGPLERLTRAGSVDQEQVAVDAAGNALAVWVRGQNVMASVRPAGGSFGVPTRLSKARDVEAVSLAMNAGGDSVVVWSRRGAGMQYSFRPAGGEFSAAARLPDVKGEAPIAALDDDGGAFVTWVQSKEVRSAYRPPGGSFGPEQPVPAVTPDQFRGSDFATDSAGRMLLAWRDGETIKAIERPPAGSFGDEPAIVAEEVKGANTEIESLVMARGGSAVIVWGHSRHNAATRDGTGPWSVPQRLAISSYYGPSAGIDAGGRAAIVWEQTDREVRGAYRDAGGTFGEPFALAPPRPFAPGPFGEPDVVVSGSGRATVSWEESDGNYASVFTRDFGAAGPSAPSQRAGRARTWHREHPRSACTPRGYRVVRRTKRAVVVVSTRGSDKGSHYACLFARGKLLSLDDDVELYGFPSIVLAGPLVANAVDACDPETCDTVVSVTDLRDEDDGVRRVTHVAPYETGELGSIVLKPTGSVAWIGCTAPGGPAFGHVRRCRRGGHARKFVYALGSTAANKRLVDAGRSIDPTSLRLRGSRLTWRHGRTRRHATLR